MKPVRSGWRIWPPVIILRYWIVQGMVFMNNIERMYRVVFELFIFLIIFAMMNDLAMYLRVLISLLIAHTLSILLNGHLFAMMTHDLFWFALYKDNKKFFNYLDRMHKRISISNPSYLDGVVFFGSLARGIFRETSDLDVRFLAKPGFCNGIKSSHFVFKERLRAFFAGFPIDAYMFASEQEVRAKMDVKNEPPVYLYSSGQSLIRMFPEAISYRKFKKKFSNILGIKNV